MRAKGPQSTNLASRVEAITHDVASLNDTLKSFAQSTSESINALTSHISKLSDRIAAAEKSTGPTWSGINQVAGVLASYSVLIAFVVGIYVRGEILANINATESFRIKNAETHAYMQAQIDFLKEGLAGPDLFTQTDTY